MASPLMDRIEPHKKAVFSLHLSETIAGSDDAAAAYRSVRYNHKPAQSSATRTTTLSTLSANTYSLTLADTDRMGVQDKTFTLTGKAAAPSTAYVLVLDAATHHATLEPLASSFTFNLTAQDGRDVSAQHPPIFPRKNRDEARGDDADLFADDARADDDAGDPDPANPYDFRHFLPKEAEKRGDESEYHMASSPEYRAPKSTKPAKSAKAVPAKRKPVAANPLVTKPKKTQPPPAVRLQRTATDTPKAKAKTVAPPASKIKSAEIIYSSDESDGDGDARAKSLSSPPRPSPSPAHQQQQLDDDDDDDDDQDADADAPGESDDDGGLEIEVPDAHPPRRGNGVLKSRGGIGQSLGVGAFMRSPSNGPISLLSATNSARGSPNPQSLASRAHRNAQDEIDFGDLEDAEGEVEDEDEEEVEEEEADEEEDEDEDEQQLEDNSRDNAPTDIGPPARQSTMSGHERKSSGIAGTVEDDEDDLEKMMMEGLAEGDSSEESEEE